MVVGFGVANWVLGTKQLNRFLFAPGNLFLASIIACPPSNQLKKLDAPP